VHVIPGTSSPCGVNYPQEQLVFSFFSPSQRDFADELIGGYLETVYSTSQG
jgi:hypothetical protein